MIWHWSNSKQEICRDRLVSSQYFCYHLGMINLGCLRYLTLDSVGRFKSKITSSFFGQISSTWCPSNFLDGQLLLIQILCWLISYSNSFITDSSFSESRTISETSTTTPWLFDLVEPSCLQGLPRLTCLILKTSPECLELSILVWSATKLNQESAFQTQSWGWTLSNMDSTCLIVGCGNARYHATPDWITDLGASQLRWNGSKQFEAVFKHPWYLLISSGSLLTWLDACQWNPPERAHVIGKQKGDIFSDNSVQA